MKKIIFLSFLTFSLQTSAESCFPLYEAEAARILKEDSYTQNLGGQLYVKDREIKYWPGIEMPADIDNWADDFVKGVKYGPFRVTFREDPREKVLKTFAKHIKDECPSPTAEYENVRQMLHELMSDGSFCPEGKMLGRPLIDRWKHFKKILRTSIKSGRFQELCQSASVANDSSREVKDVPTSGGSSNPSKGISILPE